MRRVSLLAATLFCLGAAPAIPPGSASLDSDTLLVRGGFERGHQPDGNSIVMRGPHGVVVVDTGRHAAQVDRIEAAAAWFGKPVVAIVNSHWHLDHVSGNLALRRAYPGVAVWGSLAIDGALAGFLKDSARQGQAALDKGEVPASMAGDVRGDIATISDGAGLRPDHVVESTRHVRLAGRSFDLHLSRHAATAGDVWLYDRAHHRVIAGDLVTLPAPFLDTACPQGWRAALADVAAMRFDTLVPGHGAVMTRAQFSAWQSAFGAFVDCAANAASPAAACVDGWMAYATPQLAEGDERMARGLTGYYADLIRTGALQKNCLT